MLNIPTSMPRFEVPKTPREPLASPERHKIPIEIAQAIQIQLFQHLAPETIRVQSEAGNTTLQDAFIERCLERYAVEWNALEAYCADLALTKEQREVLTRFQSGTYTEADIETLSTYLRNHTKQPLFQNTEEIESFVAQFQN